VRPKTSKLFESPENLVRIDESAHIRQGVDTLLNFANFALLGFRAHTLSKEVHRCNFLNVRWTLKSFSE